MSENKVAHKIVARQDLLYFVLPLKSLLYGRSMRKDVTNFYNKTGNKEHRERWLKTLFLSNTSGSFKLI